MGTSMYEKVNCPDNIKLSFQSLLFCYFVILSFYFLSFLSDKTDGHDRGTDRQTRQTEGHDKQTDTTDRWTRQTDGHDRRTDRQTRQTDEQTDTVDGEVRELLNMKYDWLMTGYIQFR